MRCVLHGTRRKTGSVRETSRAVRTFGVRPVRIGFARLAHQNLLLEGGTSSAAFRGARRKGRFVSEGSRTSSTHRLRTPCRPEPAFNKGQSGEYTSPPGALRTRTYFCAVCYRLREISEMEVRPDSISSGVLKWEKLKRTTPLSAVPRALCMSGAQWAPGRVQMP